MILTRVALGDMRLSCAIGPHLGTIASGEG